MQEKEFDYKGRKLVYRVKGEGPVLVLLHGFGEDGSIWKNQYDTFLNHQLVIPDLPGSGKSEMIDDMSMEGLADAVKELVNSLPAHSRIILIGHSMGGYITLAFAEKFPEILNAFGLFHSTAFADSEEKKENRQKGIKLMQEKGGYEFLKTIIPNLYGPGTKANKAELIEHHISEMRNAGTDANVMYYEAMIKRPDRTDVLRNSNVPVLLVFGKYDTAVPLEDGLKLSHLPSLSYIHILQQAGHMGMVEEPTESNQILSQFVTTVENLA